MSTYYFSERRKIGGVIIEVVDVTSGDFNSKFFVNSEYGTFTREDKQDIFLELQQELEDYGPRDR